MRPQIVFIGTSASTPTYIRLSPAILVCGIRTCILLDAGEGTQINLGRIGLDILKINIIAITHMHGDHYYGLMPIIDTITMKFTTQNIQRSHIVRLVGPRELCSSYLKQLFTSSGKVESSIENGYLHNIITPGLELECIDAETLSNGENYLYTEDGDIAISSIGVNHGDVNAFGYVVRARAGERTSKFITIFYSGDGICDSKCINILKGLNPCIVIHEATFMDYENDRSKAHQTYHATVGDAATIANAIDAKILIVTHISQRYRNEWIRDYVSRARRIFSGDIFIAEDLSILPLDKVAC